MRPRWIDLFALLFCVSGTWALAFSCAAQSDLIADKRLNQLAEKFVRDQELPGMILAIVADSKITAIGCAGVRKSGGDQPITIHDKVHLGSCTKAMTATLLAGLVDKEKLKWTSTVGEIFPEWHGKVHDDYLSVTLAQLLAHRAGMPDNARTWWLTKGDIVTTREAILVQTLAAKPVHPPGSKFLYSNVGYVLAGHMAEKVLGKSWEESIRQTIFEPLQMASAGFGVPNLPGEVDQPWGHVEGRTQTKSPGKLTASQTDNAPALGPAGTVHCSVEDWAKFLDLHLHPDSHAEFLSPQQIVTLHLPILTKPPEERPYAGGWIVSKDEAIKETILMHSGSNTAWMATVCLIPKRGVGFIAVTNLGGKRAQDTTNRAIRELIEMHLGK